jgi:hypothetical protein
VLIPRLSLIHYWSTAWVAIRFVVFIREKTPQAFTAPFEKLPAALYVFDEPSHHLGSVGDQVVDPKLYQL